MTCSSIHFCRPLSAFSRIPVLGLLFVLAPALGAGHLGAVSTVEVTAVTTWKSSPPLQNRAEYDVQGIASPLGDYVYVLWQWKTVGSVVQQTSPDGVFKNSFGPPAIGLVGGIAADPVRGDVYVINLSLKNIVKFTYKGELSMSFGDGKFSNPVAIAVGRNRCVYVCDARNCEVLKFTSEGIYQYRWKLEAGAGRTLTPNAIAVGPNDELYVLGSQISAPANNVLVYTEDGHYLRGWNSQTPDRTGGYNPVAITVNGLGTVLISDVSRTTGSVQQFSSRGDYQRALTVLVNGSAFNFSSLAFFHDDFVYGAPTQTVCKFRLF